MSLFLYLGLQSVKLPIAIDSVTSAELCVLWPLANTVVGHAYRYTDIVFSLVSYKVHLHYFRFRIMNLFSNSIKLIPKLSPVFSAAILFYQNKGKAIPLQAWTGPGGSRRLRLPDF
jgi:hypothetical protein